VYRAGRLSPGVEVPMIHALAALGWLGTVAAICGALRLHLLR
jgi:hypothetical protein